MCVCVCVRERERESVCVCVPCSLMDTDLRKNPSLTLHPITLGEREDNNLAKSYTPSKQIYLPEKRCVNDIFVKLFVDCWGEVFFLLFPSPRTPPLTDHAPHTACVGGLLEGPQEYCSLQGIEGASDRHLRCFYDLNTHRKHMCIP